MIKQLLTAFTEEFHRLDRALFQKSESSGSRVIQFTASRRSEGVTSITLAFAAFMSRLHGVHDVIVVEANLRHPVMADILQLSDGATLGDLLGRTAKIEDSIQECSDYAISVIPAGRVNPSRSEIPVEASLENITEVLTELRKKYRYILLDTPPIIPYIDAGIISGSTDGVVIVVESNSTRSEVLNDAIDRLKSAGASIIGIVLNKREFHIPRWLYRLL